MKIIPFPKNRKKVRVTLPNETTFEKSPHECRKLFASPDRLTDLEKDGLVQLAIAMLYAEHHLKGLAVNS